MDIGPGDESSVAHTDIARSFNRQHKLEMKQVLQIQVLPDRAKCKTVIMKLQKSLTCFCCALPSFLLSIKFTSSDIAKTTSECVIFNTGLKFSIQLILNEFIKMNRLNQ